MTRKIITPAVIGFGIIISISVVNCLMIGGGAAVRDVTVLAGISTRLGTPDPAISLREAPALQYAGVSVTAGREEYFEYAGVIHVHSTYSDGGGTFDEIAGIADSLGLDFIIPTDHNTIEPIADGWERMTGGVLVIPGVENSMDGGAGHYVAIGDSLTIVRSREISSDTVYADTRDRGNMIFLAHVFHPVHNNWEDWTIDDYTGIEIFNLDENWRYNIHPFRANRLIAAALVYPLQGRAIDYLITYPRAQMELFDRLNMSRKVVAIGSTDAHSRRLVRGSDAMKFPSYASMFKLVQTIIMSREPFTGEYRHDRGIVLDALREGNSYVGFPTYGDVRGFLFTAESGSARAACGDSLYIGGAARFHVELPDSLHVTVQVVRNGEVIREDVNVPGLDWTSDEPGVYRIQVFQDRMQLPFLGKRRFPWILSNPIYVARAHDDIAMAAP